MRAFIDSILTFIGSTSITDEEYDTVTATTETYDVASYASCKRILESREAVSDMTYKLAFFFLAKGVQVATVKTSEPATSETAGETPAHEPQSEIFIGAVL